jgi:predicted NodU family carbamoyl transferase
MATITEALGIKDGWYDELKVMAECAIGELETVDGVLTKVAKEIREEELGDEGNLSVYERKLLMAGYTVGCLRQAQQLRELEMIKALKSFIDKLKDRSQDED